MLSFPRNSGNWKLVDTITSPCIIIDSLVPRAIPTASIVCKYSQGNPGIKYMYHVSDINHGHQGAIVYVALLTLHKAEWNFKKRLQDSS